MKIIRSIGWYIGLTIMTALNRMTRDLAEIKQQVRSEWRSVAYDAESVRFAEQKENLMTESAIQPKDLL